MNDTEPLCFGILTSLDLSTCRPYSFSCSTLLPLLTVRVRSPLLSIRVSFSPSSFFSNNPNYIYLLCSFYHNAPHPFHKISPTLVQRSTGCRRSFMRCIMNKYGPAHEIMVLFILRKLHSSNEHAQPSSGASCLIFGRTLHLLPYFMCVNSKGSGKTVWMRRLA